MEIKDQQLFKQHNVKKKVDIKDDDLVAVMENVKFNDLISFDAFTI
ncbi:MAG: hypothetical protein ACI910_003123 [Oleispira sp.]|jgi:hypothetical protein